MLRVDSDDSDMVVFGTKVGECERQKRARNILCEEPQGLLTECRLTLHFVLQPRTLPMSLVRLE